MTFAGSWPRRDSELEAPGAEIASVGAQAATVGARDGAVGGRGVRRRGRSVPGARRSRAALWLALVKPRLNAFAVATVGIGYYLGAGALDVGVLLSLLAGSAMVAAGGAVFNQVAERDLDALMDRTRSRPLPLGDVSPPAGLLFAAVLSVAGLAVLALGANLLAAAVALATLVSYAWVYTPLKRRTPWAVLAGAVPGALPPVIGWAAATGALTVEAWLLFGIVFAWQLPHFHSLAWLHRDDYARAGFKVLAVVDPNGRRTALESAFWAVALAGLSLLAATVGLTSQVFAVAAAAFGGVFAILALRFVVVRSPGRARTLFLGSLAALPLIWIALVAGHATL